MSSKTISVRQAKMELEFALVKGDRERIADTASGRAILAGPQLDRRE